MTTQGRLTVGIIGAGRVGPVIGAGLAGAGHHIVAINAVSDEAIERADALLPGVPVMSVPEVVAAADLIVLAVPGDQLPGLVSGLAATEAWRMGQIVLHTNAEYGVSVLRPAAMAGAIPLALHPALQFTGTSMDLLKLRDARCAVTAPTAVLPIAQALVLELGAEPVIVREEDRPAYAEAIDTATQFSAAVVRQAVDLLEGIGLSEPGRLLGPVIRSAVEATLAEASGSRLDPSGADEPQE